MDSSPVDHSRKFPTLRLNKLIYGRYNSITPIEMNIFQLLMTVEHW